MAGTISELFEGMIARPAQQTQQAQIDPALQLAQLVGKPGAFAAYYSGQRNQAMANAGRNISDAMSGGQYSSGAKITPDQLPGLMAGKMADLLKGDTTDPKVQAQILQIAKVSDPKLALQLSAQFGEQNQTQSLRKTQAAKARDFGLDALADSFIGGGDMEILTTELVEFEQERVLADGTRQSKTAIARLMNADYQIIAGITRGEYDEMTPAEFRESVVGFKAETKAYRQADGSLAVMRENEQGMVYDGVSGQWKDPNAMGLTPAPQIQEISNNTQTFMEGLIDGEVKNFLDATEAVEIASNRLQTSEADMMLLNEGIISGQFGSIQLWAEKAMLDVGINLPEDRVERVERTETFFADRAKAVAEVIKAFGAGTGLSDKDREYAEKAAGGQIVMNEGTMKRILAMERRAMRGAIKTYNASIDSMVERKFIDSVLAESYKKSTPTAEGFIPSIASQVLRDPSVGEFYKVPKFSPTGTANDYQWVTKEGTPVTDTELLSSLNAYRAAD